MLSKKIKYLMVLLSFASINGAAKNAEVRKWEDMVAKEENNIRDVVDYHEQLMLKQAHQDYQKAEQNPENEIIRLQDYLSSGKINVHEEKATKAKVDEEKEKEVAPLLIHYDYFEKLKDDMQLRLILSAQDKEQKMADINKLILRYPRTVKSFFRETNKTSVVKKRNLKKSILPRLPDVVINQILKFLEQSPIKESGRVCFGAGIVDMIQLKNNKVAVLNSDADLYIWDQDTQVADKPVISRVKNMMLLSNGRLALNLYGSKIAIFDSERIKWKVSRRFRNSINKIYELIDGTILLVFDDLKTIHLVNRSTLKSTLQIELPFKVKSILPLSSNLVAINTLKSLEIFDLETEKSRAFRRYKIDDLLKLKNGNIICTCTDGALRIWNSDMSEMTDNVVNFINYRHLIPNTFTFILEKRNGNIIVATRDGQIKIWNITTKTVEEDYIIDVPISDIIELDNGDIVVGTVVGSIFILYSQQRHQYKEIYYNDNPIFDPQNAITKLMQLNDGRLIAVWRKNSWMRMWQPFIDIKFSKKKTDGCCTIA